MFHGGELSHNKDMGLARNGWVNVFDTNYLKHTQSGLHIPSSYLQGARTKSLIEILTICQTPYFCNCTGRLAQLVRALR